MNIRLYFR